MLAWEGEASWSNATCLEDSSVLVESRESLPKIGKHTLINDRATNYIAEVQESGHCANNPRRKMTINGRQIDLKKPNNWHSTNSKGSRFYATTFINAFVSFPVHCLNLRPSLNLRTPWKGGATEILSNMSTVKFRFEDDNCPRYRLSMSSKTFSASVLPSVFSRNVAIHVTKWSMNTPLTSWCRMSGAISSYRSARGSPLRTVKGCKKVVYQNLNFDHPFESKS